MKRTQCGLCLGKVTDFLNLGESPLADEFPVSTQELETFYPLGLCVCANCNLVQLSYVVSDEELYQQDYAFYTGASTLHLPYWRGYAAALRAQFPDKVDEAVLEIACNDGTLLTEMAEFGFTNLAGVDPAKGPTDVARDRGLSVDTALFDVNWACRIRDSQGPKSLVIANNVLAHVSDPISFLKGITTLLDRDGVAVIEVQYVADLLAGNMFDHVYHEHRSFFSLTTLRRAATAMGLRIFDVMWTEAQGGSIRVFLDLGVRVPSPMVEVLLLKEAWLSDWGVYDGFQGRAEHIKDRLWHLLERARDRGPVAGYAASAKATTLLNFCQIGPHMLDFVADTTPHKIGRYMPGLQIPIVEERHMNAETYLILAHNYAPRVLRRFLDQASPRWIVPLPLPVEY